MIELTTVNIEPISPCLFALDLGIVIKTYFSLSNLTLFSSMNNKHLPFVSESLSPIIK